MARHFAVVLLLTAVAGVAACQPRGHRPAEARLVPGGKGAPAANGASASPGRDGGNDASSGSSPHGAARQARLPAFDGDDAARGGRTSSRIDADPDSFLGTSPRELKTALGAPALVRREPPAEIWQYRDAACVLDLFLYPGKEGQAVTHLEARDRTAKPVAAASCLERLLRARAASVTG